MALHSVGRIIPEYPKRQRHTVYTIGHSDTEVVYLYYYDGFRVKRRIDNRRRSLRYFADPPDTMLDIYMRTVYLEPND